MASQGLLAPFSCASFRNPTANEAPPCRPLYAQESMGGSAQGNASAEARAESVPNTRETAEAWGGEYERRVRVSWAALGAGRTPGAWAGMGNGCGNPDLGHLAVVTRANRGQGYVGIGDSSCLPFGAPGPPFACPDPTRFGGATKWRDLPPQLLIFQ